MLDPDVLDPERIRPLSRDEYMSLVAMGAFEDERLELLRGQLVLMSPQGETHALVTAWLARRLTLALGEQYLVRTHSPFDASNDSMPEPDLIVTVDDGTRAHPHRGALVIEVSASTLRKDRMIKAPLYAQAGVPEYWIVDLVDTSVQVLTQPIPFGYREDHIARRGDTLRPVELPGVEILVADIPFDA